MSRDRDEVSGQSPELYSHLGREVRVLGDVIVIAAVGMRRRYVRELAHECVKALHRSTITEEIESNNLITKSQQK